MLKKFIAGLLCVCCLFSLAMPFASAAEAGGKPITVYVNGQDIGVSAYAMLLGGTSYVPIREVSVALGADRVIWRSESETAAVEIDGELDLLAATGQTYIIANGRYLYVKDPLKIVNGKLLLPVRVLAKAFGAIVVWNSREQAVYLTTTGNYIESDVDFYDADDLYWLSHIINAEAGCEPLKGKIAVGNVVMNRVASYECPNTIYDVIFDRRYGTQFTPIDNGSIYYTPNEESVIAAKLTLEGANTAGDSMYFIASYCAASSWAGRNRPFVSQIGNHCFYA